MSRCFILFEHCLCALLLLLCFGCREAHAPLEETLVSGGILSVPIPETMPLTTTCLKTNLQGGGDTLYYLDRHRGDIALVELNEGRIAGILRIPEEGPEAPGRFTGFSVLADGSVLIAPSGKPRLFLMDKKGTLIKRFDLDYHTSLQDVNYCPLVSRLYLDAYFDGEKLFWPQQLYGLPSALSYQRIRHSMLFEYRVPEDRGRFCNVWFPTDYFDEKLLPKNFSACTDGSVFVFSLQGKGELIVYDLEQDKSREANAKSRYLREIAPMLADDMESWMEYEARNGSYESILYDPFRRRYYRFVKLGATPEEIQEYGRDHLHKFPLHFSIIILDTKLNNRGEVRFDGSEYKMDNAFVGRKGLYLSRANPLASGYSEDSLKFELFELVPE